LSLGSNTTISKYNYSGHLVTKKVVIILHFVAEVRLTYFANQCVVPDKLHAGEKVGLFCTNMCLIELSPLALHSHFPF